MSTLKAATIQPLGSSDSLIFNTNDVERLRITSTGAVGIATSTPSSKLGIGGDNGSTTLTGLASFGGIHFTQTSTNDRYVGFTTSATHTGTQGGILIQGSGSYGTKIHFLTTDSYAVGMKNRMTLDHLGALTVNDSTISCNYSIRANAPSAQGWLELSDGLPGYIGTHRYPTLKTSGSYLYFSANGSYSSDISAAGTYTARSDRSMKENISTIDNCLSLVERLRGVQFTWKNSNMGDGLNYGFIAQEVQEVIPEIVSDNANVGLLGIAESKIIPFLVEAVKELKQIIDAKNNIITQLQSKIESLESKVTALEQSSQQ